MKIINKTINYKLFFSLSSPYGKYLRTQNTNLFYFSKKQDKKAQNKKSPDMDQSTIV